VAITFFAAYYRALYGREETLSQTAERLRTLTENLSKLDEERLAMVDAVVASLLGRPGT
jgi:molybdopterin converting factor small subunit